MDQYAYAVDPKLLPERVKVDFEIPEIRMRGPHIGFWRHHHDLNRWMRALYLEKGGSRPGFNVAPLLLTLEDLSALEQAVLDKTLPKGDIFSMGDSNPEFLNDDIRFLRAARSAISNGKVVFYFVWK